MNDNEKVIIFRVDRQTAQKITVTKSLKTWLKYHPNFKRQSDGKFMHIYENEALAWQEDMNERQRLAAEEDTADSEEGSGSREVV